MHFINMFIGSTILVSATNDVLIHLYLLLLKPLVHYLLAFVAQSMLHFAICILGVVVLDTSDYLYQYLPSRKLVINFTA